MKSIKLYVTLFCLIIGWWTVAFRPTVKSTSPLTLTPHTSTEKFAQPRFLSPLSPMSRQLIHQALSGDVKLMTQLIAEWDIDAQIMEQDGMLDVIRLPRSQYLRAQVLGRQLLDSTVDELERLRMGAVRKEIRDDLGHAIAPKLETARFLPQTYISASFLLALTDPEKIVGIPSGIRHLTQIYDEQNTQKISNDVNRLNSEKLFLQNPEVAFVAHFSDPATLDALRNQGVALFTLKGPENRIDAIIDALNRIGNVVNRPIKSELLALFMESAMLAIDNRLLALQSDASPRVMMLNKFAHLSIPTGKTLTGHFMKRMQKFHFEFFDSALENLEQWSQQIDLEQISKFNPDCLLVASKDPESVFELISHEPVLQNLSAAQCEQVYLIDYDLQQSPTQYSVLAYYDLANILSQYHLAR